MAITAAGFKGYERTGNSYRIRVILTDAAAPGGAYERWITVTGNTLKDIIDQASQQVAALVAADSQKDVLAGIAGDAVIPITYSAPVVTPDADDVWLGQVALLIRMKAAQAAGLTDKFDGDVAALLATVTAGYTTARGQKL